MSVLRMTPKQDAIIAEIDAAEAALDRYDHVSQATPTEIDRARKAVDTALHADMPDGSFFGLRRYLSIYDRPEREAETQAKLGSSTIEP